MLNSKRFFFTALSLTIIVWSFLPQAVFASKSDYYDFGPYYSNEQVLGFSFSSLENLPAPKLADNLMPGKATGILPDSPFYFFERAVENTQLTFTFDPVKKEELRLGFASERLSEAKTLLDAGKTEAAVQSFNYYNQILKDVSQNIVNADRVEEIVSAQAVVTQSLALTSTPVQAQEWNLATKAVKETLDKAVEVKGGPAIPEDLSTDIQRLKEQGLISEEESNKLYSLKNRGEVREELDKLAISGQFPASELIKLDTAVAKNYPEVHEQMGTNFQVAELRTYQTRPQPSEEILNEIKKWQSDSSVPPSNNIKPYLWYNRAQDLAKEVDLSSFSPEQQQDVGKLFPKEVSDNPTYEPLPQPSPSPSADGPSPSPAADVSPTPTAVQTNPYLGGAGGALPGQPTYFIKRWGENLQTTFTFDPVEKAKLKLQQAERRLNEAAVLSADAKKSTEYQDTIKSYSRAMADASSYLKNSNDETKARDTAGKLEVAAARHGAMLEKGFLPAPKDQKLITEAIKAVEDALDRSADVFDRPALPPALVDRLGDLKAQGLILPEEADDLVRSNSREEAREKIRKLVELGSFPLADSKKMDEAQMLTSTSDYNQLVEVKKVEELQNLRAVQSEFAQTPTLKASAANLGQKEVALVNSIDLSGIKQEDLGGRQDLVQTYQQLTATASARPINNGQFGPEATPGAQPVVALPRDAVASICPDGATFKKLEGCVWADTGRRINDYDQYKCDGPRQYYSFAAKKCVAYEPGKGIQDDRQPICPVGYTWVWQSQSCESSVRNLYPTPSPEPEPINEEERQARAQFCPEGSDYKPPRGCVWEKSDKPVYDSGQYRCTVDGQYYSFGEQKCVPAPKEGETYPEDTTPDCKESGSFFSWNEGKCITIIPAPGETEIRDLPVPKPFLGGPDSPWYTFKTWGEAVRLATAFTPEAKQEIRTAQAKERLAEGYAALGKGDQEDFSKALSAYTAKMQDIYNDVSKSSLSKEAKKAIGERLAKEVVEQNLILQKIEVVATDEQTPVISAASSVVILGVDKAADLVGEPPLPDDLKTKVEALPAEMISEEDKKKLLEAGSRVEARLQLGELAARGGLTALDTAFLNEDFDAVDPGVKVKLGELKKLEEIADTLDQREKTLERVEKNELITEKLNEFQKSFEPGQDIPADIRPYVRLTRIDEVTQTIRPDIVKLADFQNRKDVVLAVATLQEEFRPTQQAKERVELFRRYNPGSDLPPELARIEALSFSLGVRNQAGPCYLPTPPFPANTPCPPPGAAIPIASYTNYIVDRDYPVYGRGPGYPGGYTGYTGTPATDKDGKPLVYGQGPKPASAGACPDGFHWMYDSGGWCMSNGGNYSQSPYNYTPSGPQTPGYTPYSPYYNAPGAYPATSGYPVGDNSPNDGCPYGSDSDGRGNCIPNSYGQGGYSYSPPSYYGSAPTYYTTNPPSGTVPGSGPQPTSPGKCPSGFHWMSDSGGWCMADGPTYVPGGSTYYSPNLNQSSCGPGYYWDGRGCIRTSPTDTYGSCTSPAGGCGYNSYWDYGSCSCKSSSTYSGGGGVSPSNYCQGLSCGGGTYLDYSTCSCKSSGSYSGSGSYSSGWNTTSGSCTQRTCNSGEWFDWGTCSCRPSSNTYSGTTSGSGSGSSTGCANVSASSCGSGWYWDSSACTCRQTTTSDTSGSTTSSSGGSSGSSSGSCPSGYHWMSDNGGWCMSDGAASSSGGSTSTSTTTTTSEPAPAPSTSTSTESAPSTSSEPAPAPSTSTSTESSPP